MGARKKVTIKRDANGKVKDQTEVIETDEGGESEEGAAPSLFDDAMTEVSANLGKGAEPDVEFKLYQVEKGKPPLFLRDLTKTECSESFIQTNYPAGGDFIIRGRNLITGDERVWNISIKGLGAAPVLPGFPINLGPGQDGTTALVGLMISQMAANQSMMIEQMRLNQQASEKRTETLITALAPIAASVLPAIMNRKDPDKELIDTLLKVMAAAKGGDSEALGMILDFARAAASEVAKVINPAASATDNPVVATIQTLGPTLQAILGGLFNRFGPITSPSGPPAQVTRPNGGLHSSPVTNAVVPNQPGGAGPSAHAGAATTAPPQVSMNFKQLFERFVLPEMTKAAKLSKFEESSAGITWLTYAPGAFAETLKFNVLQNYGLTEELLKKELLESYPSWEVFGTTYQGIFNGPDSDKLEQWFYDFYVELGGPELQEPGTTAEAVEGEPTIS